MDSTEMRGLVKYIDNRIVHNASGSTDVRLIATVISISTTSWYVTVHLPTDPVGTNIDVINVREILLEVGDDVYIIAIDGKLNNAFIDCRKAFDYLRPIQADKRFEGTVISYTAGVAQVQLDVDSAGTYRTCSNLRELPVETGDPVSIIAINGDLNYCFIDYRESVLFDNIYVNYSTGVDDENHGTNAAPFKTLQYAMKRLPKNLNNRNITITIQNAPVGGGASVMYTDGFYGGYLTIQGLSGSYADVNTLWLTNCSATINLYYLTPKNVSGLYLSRLINCSNICFNNCNFTTVETIAIGALYGSNVYVKDCQISNQTFSGVAADYNSKIFCEDCTGSNAGAVVYMASRNSSIGADNCTITGGSTTDVDGTSLIVIGGTIYH